ncbi:MAG: TetR/AcrR family transcriptional regulator [Deltaproteobacteria bacterium]|nr:TetR/AcrR family transcriptional regulator [Deltaproteobacteria bacterium]
MSDRTESRGRIIASARRLFYEAGYENTSYADLAAAAGVPKGNFYYHFKSKDELLGAVLEARHADVAAALDTWAAQARTPQEGLRRFVRMVMSEEEALVAYGCPVGSLLTELGKHRDDLREAARAVMDLYVEWLTARFTELGHPARHAEVLAKRLLARAQGAIVMAHAYGDQALLRRELKDIEAWLSEQAPT